MEREERITEMEAILNHSQEVVEKAQQLLKILEENKKEYRKLVKYYYSRNWVKDVDACERRLLSPDLKCGVLSEDAIYNLICDRNDLAISMLEEAADILKKQ